MDRFHISEREVTREELTQALQDIIRLLSLGIKGQLRVHHLQTLGVVQNELFSAGVSGIKGPTTAYTVTLLLGTDDDPHIQIGSEDDVHALAANPDEIASMVGDFIETIEEEAFEEKHYKDDDPVIVNGRIDWED